MYAYSNDRNKKDIIDKIGYIAVIFQEKKMIREYTSSQKKLCKL